jgi:hypothetical protein
MDRRNLCHEVYRGESTMSTIDKLRKMQPLLAKAQAKIIGQIAGLKVIENKALPPNGMVMMVGSDVYKELQKLPKG